MNRLNLILTGLMAGSLAFVANAHQDNSFSIVGAAGKASGQKTEIDVSKLPQTGDGIKIVNASELPDLNLPPEIKQGLESQKKLGYIPRRSADATQLLAIKKFGFQSPGDERYFNTTDNKDTHLKKSVSQIKLAFDYQPLSFISEKDTLGFAPAMTYKNEGWTGISQFFNDEKIGICKYLKYSVSLNGSAIHLAKQRISLYINKKPAQILSEGQNKDGFAYLIHWYDNDYFHELTCANEHFSKGNIAETHIASRINR